MSERNADGTYKNVHGMTNTRLYKVWCAMRERCNNPHNKRYERYGGRGIEVTPEWDDFSKFYEWAMQSGYADSLTIDRIDNNQNYMPANCRWVTTKEQNRNYSRNHNITFNGETHCIVEWSEITGIDRATILYRIQANKPLEEVFDKEDGRSKRWQKQRACLKHCSQ